MRKCIVKIDQMLQKASLCNKKHSEQFFFSIASIFTIGLSLTSACAQDALISLLIPVTYFCTPMLITQKNKEVYLRFILASSLSILIILLKADFISNSAK